MSFTTRLPMTKEEESEYDAIAEGIIGPLRTAGLDKEEMKAVLAKRVRQSTEAFIKAGGNADSWTSLFENMIGFQAIGNLH
jgi:hypothetical protein